MSAIPVGEILQTLELAEDAFDLGGKLLLLFQQRHPELRTEAIPDEGAAMDAAREAALTRKGEP